MRWSHLFFKFPFYLQRVSLYLKRPVDYIMLLWCKAYLPRGWLVYIATSSPDLAHTQCLLWWSMISGGWFCRTLARQSPYRVSRSSAEGNEILLHRVADASDRLRTESLRFRLSVDFPWTIPFRASISKFSCISYQQDNVFRFGVVFL